MTRNHIPKKINLQKKPKYSGTVGKPKFYNCLNTIFTMEIRDATRNGAFWAEIVILE